MISLLATAASEHGSEGAGILPYAYGGGILLVLLVLLLALLSMGAGREHS